MSLLMKAAHWSLKSGGRLPARAISAICSVAMLSDSRAASSRKEPVPALQASFMA